MRFLAVLLGLRAEHNKPGRDNFVQINVNNMNPGNTQVRKPGTLFSKIMVIDGTRQKHGLHFSIKLCVNILRVVLKNLENAATLQIFSRQRWSISRFMVRGNKNLPTQLLCQKLFFYEHEHHFLRCYNSFLGVTRWDKTTKSKGTTKCQSQRNVSIQTIL